MAMWMSLRWQHHTNNSQMLGQFKAQHLVQQKSPQGKGTERREALEIIKAVPLLFLRMCFRRSLGEENGKIRKHEIRNQVFQIKKHVSMKKVEMF